MTGADRHRLPSVAGVLVSAVLASIVTLTACTATPLAARVWPAADSADVGEPFAADFLIADRDFEDGTFLSPEAVQEFFAKPPYGPPSFLATYTDKGRRASDLLVGAAAKHRISALWLLARLERDGVLVAARRYPSDSKDVEYAFDYGCSGRRSCDATFGGLGAQLDALAGDLRRSLADVRASGVSANGFGQGLDGSTLDGVRVTPATASTAALYALEPVVRGPGGGQELTWRIYRHYAAHTGYFPEGASGP